MNVLILDDDERYMELVCRPLRPISETVTCVTTWAQALAQLEQQMPNVFWVDLNVNPEGPSESIAHIAAVSRRFPDLVIVVVSGYLLPGSKALLDKAGATLAMEKGSRFDPVEVASVVLLAVYIAAKKSGKGPNSEFLTNSTKLLAPHIDLQWHPHPVSELSPDRREE